MKDQRAGERVRDAEKLFSSKVKDPCREQVKTFKAFVWNVCSPITIAITCFLMFHSAEVLGKTMFCKMS